MAVRLDEIRKAAERVAASHGLDVVDVEFAGSAKDRILRVYLEKNAEGRAKLKAEIAAGSGRIAGSAAGGDAEPGAAFRRHARRLRRVQPGFWRAAGRGRPGSRRRVHAGGQFAGAGPEAEHGRRISNGFTGCLVKVQTFEPIRNNRHWQGRLMGSPVSESNLGQLTIAIDLGAVKQNSKSRKTGVNTVEIALNNIEKAQLVPEI